jgi:hypothetical protein
MAKQDFLAGSDAPSLVIKPRRLKPVALRKVWWIAVAVIGLCVVSGMAYEAFATYRHRMIPAPGKLVAVGGYRLYIDCRGQGSPTVVIESGLGDASDVWQDLLPKFSAMSRTCAYDRAGLGRSENGPLPRSAEQIAKELRVWLRHSGEAGPHILVAHSTGRYPVRVFAKEYPNEVAGLLLLKVSHPDQNQRESAAANKDRDDFMVKQAWWGRLAPFGITRMLGHCDYHPQDCGRSFRTTL